MCPAVYLRFLHILVAKIAVSRIGKHLNAVYPIAFSGIADSVLYLSDFVLVKIIHLCNNNAHGDISCLYVLYQLFINIHKAVIYAVPNLVDVHTQIRRIIIFAFVDKIYYIFVKSAVFRRRRAFYLVAFSVEQGNAL